MLFTLLKDFATHLTRSRLDKVETKIAARSNVVIRALALQSQSRFPEAEGLLRLLVDQNPSDPDVLHLLANNLIAQNRHQQALEYLEHALTLRPRSALIHHERGIAAAALSLYDSAEQHFQQAIALDANFVEALASYASLLACAGRLDEAEASYGKALQLRPDFSIAAYNFGRMLHAEGRVAEAVAYFLHAFTVNPSLVDAHSNYIYGINFDPSFSPTAVFEAHLDWAKAHAEPLRGPIQSHTNDTTVNRVLRIGYVSPNFKAHAAAYFFESTLKCHDFAKVELFGYSDVIEGDDYTERIKRHFSNWRACAHLDDAQLAAQVICDKIDILVDLSGHTSGNRLAVFARKPAPVQITWNGYANTTGMSAMDYRITDYLADPPGMTEHLHSEKLLRMPEVYMVFSPPLASPDIGALPAAGSGTVTFGSFNAVTKITPAVLETWSRILKAVPDSRLLIAAVPSKWAQARISRLLENHGVDPTRLDFHGPSPRVNFLALRNEADIALDPFPFNGTTTTCESLWMGVPVVTLAGLNHASRVGVSFLTIVGMPQLVSQSLDEYVETAVSLANDRARLTALRAGMRESMLASPLMDAARFSRHLENAYREVWRSWCEERAAQLAEPGPAKP